MTLGNLDTIFINNIQREFSHILGEKCHIQINAPDFNDILKSSIMVGWRNYSLSIDIESVGPARLRDMIEIFTQELHNKYPELLL